MAYDGSGTCYGGFLYCDCATAPETYITPSYAFNYEVEPNGDGSYTISFWWSVSNFYGDINYASCGGSGACASTGYALATPESTPDNNVDEDYAYEDCVQ